MRRFSVLLPFARPLPTRLTLRFVPDIDYILLGTSIRVFSTTRGINSTTTTGTNTTTAGINSTTITTTSSSLPQTTPSSPFHFLTGTSLFAKRAPRPFPPPFLSPPSGSFSDPLSTHHRARDRRGAWVRGEVIRGQTNGDDAVYAGRRFVGVGDGVGAWSTRKGGHAGLWSRLIVHFWAAEIERLDEAAEPIPVEYLQRAYERTLDATTRPTEWQGTTTAAGALLHFESIRGETGEEVVRPVLYVTNLGDSQVLVVRPREAKAVYKTVPQWHWFDCPRQLGTNSPDTPRESAIVDRIVVEEGDVVLAMSDGVTDNLWEHEVVSNVVGSMGELEGSENKGTTADGKYGEKGMHVVAEKLMNAARVIAQDPFAESPFMEHAIEEGLAMEGGKLDDISVVVALIKRSAE